MKSIKLKSMIITCILCLLPIIPGIVLWDKLPEKIAIHFNIYGEPDNYWNKGFVVFLLPFIMAVFQAVCSLIYDLNSDKQRAGKRLIYISKGIIPVMSILLCSLTYLYSLGGISDIRCIIAIFVGALLVVMGFGIMDSESVNGLKVDSVTAKRINRLMGILTMIMGGLMLLTILLPPSAMVIWLLLLFPYILIPLVYGLAISKRK